MNDSTPNGPVPAEAHYNRGLASQKLNRLDEALAGYDQAIALQPDLVEAHNNRGAILQSMKRYAEALSGYDQAIALKPDFAAAYYNRGNVLQELKRYEDASASYEQALTLKPNFAPAHNNLGKALQKLKRYDAALAAYGNALALQPDYAEAYQNRGATLVSTGDMQEAEKMFLTSLVLKPDCSSSYLNLVSIHEYKDPDHAHATRIRTLLDNPNTALDDRECLNFALGKIYDDCGLYDEAFECYRQANEIHNAGVSYSQDGVSLLTHSIIEVFTKDFLAQPFASASDSPSPLFIVGMPRSGTTLMASMLSNHPSIGTAGELPTMNECVLRLPQLTGSVLPYPFAVKQITPEAASHLTYTYEQRLRRDIGLDVPYVIDKHPLNFRHLGFIAMLFPKSKIIHCTRHPLDTALSNYFQRFSSQYAYSFDLRNIGHFYGEYAKLMAHWREVLPIQMLEVSYENMVTNTEKTARRALDFLRMEWDERCLAPHTNPYPVETASRWQVRQKIYQQSVGRWQHYEKHLAPLKVASVAYRSL